MNDDEFCALYDAHARRVWAYVARMTRDHSVADDIVQEAFLRVHSAAALANATEEHRRHYLYTVATNLVRRRARTAREVHVDDTTPEAGHVENVEEQLAVQQTLDALPLIERQTLWLGLVERWTSREIAAMLGYREGSVRQVAVRARRRFAELFTQPGPGDTHP